MALPGNINTITVTGTWYNLTGTAATGTVTFTVTPGAFEDAAAPAFLIPGPVVATLSSGAISVVLPCTDNTTLAPTSFTYTVTEQINGSVRSYVITLPHTLGASVDLATLAH